ncbi:MAG: DUF6984 family protein [Balneola sp.]
MIEKALNRKLTLQEEELVIWLIKNGQNSDESYLDQVNDLRVASYCKCGCASIDFKVINSGFNVVSDFLYREESGNLMGIYLFETENQLAGLDLWSVDGGATPKELPDIESLFPFENQ